MKNIVVVALCSVMVTACKVTPTLSTPVVTSTRTSSPSTVAVPTSTQPLDATPSQTPRPSKSPPAEPTEQATSLPMLSAISYWTRLPKGEYWAYTALDGRTVNGAPARSIYVISVDNQLQERLTVGATGDAFGEALAPDGSKVAYIKGFEIQNTQLRILDLITNESSDLHAAENCIYPSWSPDSIHISMSCNGRLAVISLATKSLTSLPEIDETGFAARSAWSPNGRWLAYIHTREEPPQPQSVGYDEIYLLDTGCFSAPTTCASKKLGPFTARAYYYESPIAWSSDSQKIVVADGRTELRLIQIPSGQDRVLLRAGQQQAYYYAYAWSSSDESLAYSIGLLDFNIELLTVETMETRLLREQVGSILAFISK